MIEKIKKACKEIKPLLKSFAYYSTDIENIPLLETLNKFQDVPEKSRLQCAVRFNKGQTQYFTGCANSLPLTENCRKCPFWSEEIWIKRHESLKNKQGVNYDKTMSKLQIR